MFSKLSGRNPGRTLNLGVGSLLVVVPLPPPPPNLIIVPTPLDRSLGSHACTCAVVGGGGQPGHGLPAYKRAKWEANMPFAPPPNCVSQKHQVGPFGLIKVRNCKRIFFASKGLFCLKKVTFSASRGTFLAPKWSLSTLRGLYLLQMGTFLF